MFRWLNSLMAVLFAFAAAVQYNDPDPWLWAAIYSAACVLSAIAAVRGSAPSWALMMVGLLAFGWSILWWSGSTGGFGVYARMFDAWEMKSLAIEEAREVSGLLIVVFWMVVNLLRTRVYRPESER